MSRKSFALIPLLVSTVFFLGCGTTAPILNFTGTPVTTASGNKTKTKQVKKAIILAGTAKGWQMKDVKPGFIQATIFKSNLMAKIDIKYNANSYSITYNDSSNMRYNGSVIHKRYNHWIRLLNDRIRNELIRL